MDSVSESYTELRESESETTTSGCSKSHATIVSGVTKFSGTMPTKNKYN